MCAPLGGRGWLALTTTLCSIQAPSQRICRLGLQTCRSSGPVACFLNGRPPLPLVQGLGPHAGQGSREERRGSEGKRKNREGEGSMRVF